MADIQSWLARYFRASFNKHEAQFPCPKCSHISFYFNYKTKLIGYCHRASCHYSPTLQDLIELVGHGPNDFFSERTPTKVIPSEPQEISFPEGARKLVELVDGKFHSDYEIAIQNIYSTRFIPIELQYSFNLHIGNNKVYIPVYLNGKMINYVGRAIWWLGYNPVQRYEYAKGIKTTDFIFNWDNAKTWPNITLVENTFNAIWLHRENVTSNFGSHLSDKQINLLTQSKAGGKGSITLLWDEGAEVNAEKAVKKLRMRGLDAAYIKIKGQPDDHSKEELISLINKSHE